MTVSDTCDPGGTFYPCYLPNPNVPLPVVARYIDATHEAVTLGTTDGVEIQGTLATPPVNSECVLAIQGFSAMGLAGFHGRIPCMAVLDARWWPTLATTVQPDLAPAGRGRKPDWNGRAVVTHALLWEQGAALAAGDDLVRHRCEASDVQSSPSGISTASFQAGSATADAPAAPPTAS